MTSPTENPKRKKFFQSEPEDLLNLFPTRVKKVARVGLERFKEQFITVQL